MSHSKEIGIMGMHPLDPLVLMAEKAIAAGCRRLYIREELRLLERLKEREAWRGIDRMVDTYMNRRCTLVALDPIEMRLQFERALL